MTNRLKWLINAKYKHILPTQLYNWWTSTVEIEAHSLHISLKRNSFSNTCVLTNTVGACQFGQQPRPFYLQVDQDHLQYSCIKSRWQPCIIWNGWPIFSFRTHQRIEAWPTCLIPILARLGSGWSTKIWIPNPNHPKSKFLIQFLDTLPCITQMSAMSNSRMLQLPADRRNL